MAPRTNGQMAFEFLAAVDPPFASHTLDALRDILV
jgi:hypothetical protein